MEDCLFCKIASHDIPKEFLYEDNDLMAFADIRPQKPVHILIVPKEHIKDFVSLSNNTTWVKIRSLAQELIHEKGLTDKGFQLKTNGGGLQEIDHLHFHLLGPFSSKL